MSLKALVVEDEILVAVEIEHILMDMGLEVIGIASDSRTAMSIPEKVDIAIVDLNLNDGATGRGVGEFLANEHGATVVYMTANPSQIKEPPRATLGVLPKPASDLALVDTINFAIARHKRLAAEPPKQLVLFNR